MSSASAEGRIGGLCYNMWGSKPKEPCFTNRKNEIVKQIVDQLEKLDKASLNRLMRVAAREVFDKTFKELGGPYKLITPESLVADIQSEISARQTKKMNLAVDRMKALLAKLVEGNIGDYKRNIES